MAEPIQVVQVSKSKETPSMNYPQLLPMVRVPSWVGMKGIQDGNLQIPILY